MDIRKEITRALTEIREIEVKIDVLKGRLAERQSALRKLRVAEVDASVAVQRVPVMAS